MSLKKAVAVMGLCFIFIHKMKIDSVTVCGFSFSRSTRSCSGHARPNASLPRGSVMAEAPVQMN